MIYMLSWKIKKNSLAGPTLRPLNNCGECVAFGSHLTYLSYLGSHHIFVFLVGYKHRRCHLTALL